MNKVKLKEEFNFLNSVPDVIKHYYPAVKDFKEQESSSSYLIQKIPVHDLSFEIIKENLDESIILNLLEKLDEYLALTPKKKISGPEWQTVIQREILDKNLDRLHQIESMSIEPELNLIGKSFGFNSIREYFETLNSAISERLAQEASETLYFSHGDLCFSNLLLWKDQLYLIDPKGAKNQALNFRPIHYELAKISQSLLGQYDYINHGLYRIEAKNNIHFNYTHQLVNVRKIFNKLIESKQTSYNTVRLVEASLFASLIPFHQESDDKMKAFFINSVKIFKEVL